MNYKMIVLDLDGTLTNRDKVITEKTRHALMEAQKRGKKVVLASGRPTYGVVPLAEELELAYAITVHKSQGSEYPAVIIPLLQGPRLLYNRNLLYTAVTRAKKCLTIVGSEQVFQEMIRNKSEQNRYTSLAERICEF